MDNIYVVEVVVPGLVGKTGPSGGEKGDTGATGGTGPQGNTGAQGVKGDSGIQGPNGNTGPIGYDGPQGIEGPQGVEGPDGPAGPVGPTYMLNLANTSSVAEINALVSDPAVNDAFVMTDGGTITYGILEVVVVTDDLIGWGSAGSFINFGPVV